MATPYWEHRAALRQAAYDRANNKVVETVSRAYDRTMRQLDKDIDTIMATYTRKTGLSVREAYDFLREGVPESVMDDLRSRAAVISDPRQRKRLEVMLRTDAYRARISRLDAIKASTRVGLTEAAEAELGALEPHLRHTADLAYSRTMFDIQKTTAGFQMAGVPRRALDTILKSKWAGTHYSTSVWQNRDAMAGILDRALMEVSGMGKLSDMTMQDVRGMVDLDKWRNQIKSKFKTEAQYQKYAANRLIRTESAYVANQTTATAYEECGIERYEYIATLDSRTSEKCGNLDGQIIDLDKKEVGVNWPPLHPHCRSSVAPVIDGLTREGLTRAARDANGKSVYVPRDMKYQEWQAWQKEGAPSDVKAWRESKASKPVAEAKPPAKAFVKANTVEEAAQALKRDFGIDADFAKFGVDEANHVSQAVYETHGAVGDKGFTKLKGIAPAPKGTAVRYAAYYNPNDEIIYVKNYTKGGVERLAKNAKDNFASGFLSTDSPFHVIRHELGHAVQKALFAGPNAQSGDEYIRAVYDLRQEVRMLPVKLRRRRSFEESVSDYAMSNDAEFVSESYAEYLNGNPRGTAAAVMKLVFARLRALQ